MIFHLAQLCYRCGLRAYPPDFRKRYGREMSRVFAEGFDRARAQGGWTLLAYGARTSADLGRSALWERGAALDRRTALAGGAAALVGAYSGYVDFHATEVQATLLVVLLGSFLLGFLASRGAWRWAVVIAVWVPALQVIDFASRHRGLSPGHPYLSRMLILAPTLVASLLGAYVGVLVRHVFRQPAPFPDSDHRGRSRPAR
jgi:hypothetical protein